MKGQWIGPYTGTNSGLFVIDLDKIRDRYQGTVFAYSQNAALPPMMGQVSIPEGQSRASLRIELVPVDRDTANLLDQNALAAKFPAAQVPKYADTAWEIAQNQISIAWETDVGTSGSGTVLRSEADQPSKLVASQSVTTWSEFKEYASKSEPFRYMYRGQENNNWKLRTSFHRTGRASLYRFLSEDLNALHRHLSGLTAHRFNLSDPLDNAAFMHLVQHHGYPTPLLDWTSSPFIAAYFAFKSLRRDRITADNRVRILIFDGIHWSNSLQRALVLNPAFLHITVLAPLAINNPRVVPQQSVSTASNVDDIEMYIADYERSAGKTLLAAIDLPAIERRTVMQELSVMGINAGSLFPGLDGACEQLKERSFDL
jgi:FRG domain